jgi:2'-5' RNA ligase
VGTTIGVAIDIPEPWGSQLTMRRAAAGDPQAAHVPAHLTLLGPTEVAPDDLDDIDAHLATVAATHPGFTLHLRGTGTFRPVTDVVFVAVAAGISECELLAESVRAAPAIHRPQRFPYHPHVTVAQDVPARQLDRVFAELAGFEARFPVVGYTLFEHCPAGHWRSHRDYVLTG